jgi:hypothetical protein
VATVSDLSALCIAKFGCPGIGKTIGLSLTATQKGFEDLPSVFLLTLPASS